VWRRATSTDALCRTKPNPGTAIGPRPDQSRKTSDLQDEPDQAQRRQLRLAGAVIIFVMVGWFAASALGGALGLPVRFAFLIDLAAMAAMIWALVVLYRLWRARQGDGV